MELPEPSDEALVRAARLGDETAFAAIVERHGPVMWRYASYLLGQDADASDATQEALVSAWQGLESFRGDSSLRTWLFTLVSRRAADLRRKRRPAPLDDAGLELHLDAVPDVTLEGVREHELVTAVRAALLELPVLQRSCWVLRELEGLSYEEIATTLGITSTSVRGCLSRGRTALAVKMEAWR